jgi:alkyl sulfatase BDS1-like metallo-beta-lactamase superfamily hydrolase
VTRLVNHRCSPTRRQGAPAPADALEQLGYRAESGPWRARFCDGGAGLRNGVPQLGRGPGTAADIARAMTTEMLIDYLAVRLDGEAAAGRTIELTLRVTDRDEVHAVGIRDGALHHTAGRPAARADATVALSHAALLALAMGTSPLAALEATAEVRIEGERGALEDLLALLDTFTFWFAIAEP